MWRAGVGPVRSSLPTLAIVCFKHPTKEDGAVMLNIQHPNYKPYHKYVSMGKWGVTYGSSGNRHSH